MGQLKSTTRNRKNKDLNEKERIKIEALLDKGCKSSEIARQLNRSKSTIYREIKRGTVVLKQSDLSEKAVYRYDHGHLKYKDMQENKGRPLKIGYDYTLSRYIEDKILNDKYSPAAIIGEIKQKCLVFKEMICARTVYNYVGMGIFVGISASDLPYKKKQKKKAKKDGKIAKSRAHKSIEERPETINERKDFGHWEMDLIKGKVRTKTCLLTISERLTRKEIIIKLCSGTVEEVDKALTGLENILGRKFNDIFKTITVDNGSEFLDWEKLEESKIKPGAKRTYMYFAHPYSSYERGTNENGNRIIRRFIPKGIDIGEVAEGMVGYVQKWMNNYPRGIFGYKTANDMIRQIVTKKQLRMLEVLQ